MQEYLVQWESEIEIEAESPQEAAKIYLATILSKANYKKQYFVTDFINCDTIVVDLPTKSEPKQQVIAKHCSACVFLEAIGTLDWYLCLDDLCFFTINAINKYKPRYEFKDYSKHAYSKVVDIDIIESGKMEANQVAEYLYHKYKYLIK